MFKDIELKEKEEFKLESLEIGITSRCNLSCEYCCAYGKDEQQVLDGDRVISLIRDLKDLKRVKLSGGEVLLYFEECLKIVSYCSEHQIETQINTNGTLLNPQKIEALREAGLGTLHFSVNFDTAEAYASYYKQPEKIFYLLERVIRTSVGAGIHVVAETILFRETADGLMGLLEYLSSLFVSHVEIQMGIAIERNGWNQALKKNEIKNIIRLAAAEKPENMELYFSCLPESVLEMVDREACEERQIYFPKCIDGRNQFHLHSNGDVLVCELGYPLVLGNVFRGFELNNVVDVCYRQLKDFKDHHQCAKYSTYD